MIQIDKLDKDIKVMVKTMSRDEARFLVDYYYIVQEDRKRSFNQERALSESNEEHEVISWLAGNSKMLEGQVKSALGLYAKSKKIGEWSQRIIGIGPVISAGLIAHIDINQAPVAGNIWRYAGLDPTQKWLSAAESAEIVKGFNEKDPDKLIDLVAIKTGIRATNIDKFAKIYAGEGKKVKAAHIAKAVSRRPFNAEFKTLCWKIGESFVKVSGKEDSFYGALYRDRKNLETGKNEAGNYERQAKQKLIDFNIGKSTDAYKSYIKGMLPPAHIQARVKRYTVKMFLSHWQEMAWRFEFGEEPPKPYAIDQLKHGHYIKPPCYDLYFN